MGVGVPRWTFYLLHLFFLSYCPFSFFGRFDACGAMASFSSSLLICIAHVATDELYRRPTSHWHHRELEEKANRPQGNPSHTVKKKKTIIYYTLLVSLSRMNHSLISFVVRRPFKTNNNNNRPRAKRTTNNSDIFWSISRLNICWLSKHRPMILCIIFIIPLIKYYPIVNVVELCIR